MNKIARGTAVCATIGLFSLSAMNANAAPRTHDGFYLGLDAGLGYLRTSASYAGFDEKISGMTLDSALWLGGTVGPVVIGGGFMYANSFSPSYSRGGQSVKLENISQYLIAIGPFVDVYPDPHSGLHFMGFAGWGGLETSVDGNVGGSDPTGLVTMLGGGYEFWLADEWSLGPLARLTYAPLSLNDVGYSTLAFSVVADVKFH